MLDIFKFYVDVDIDFEKSTTSSSKGKINSLDESRYDNMIFSGVASDATKDAEEEVLDPDGFIYDRFLKSGLINLDHLPTRSPINKSRFWIGEPLDAYVKDGKFFVKGKLWKRSPEARAFWDKAIEMKESGSNRKPGMSVEGKALQRDARNPKKVTKALITNLALTMTPVNPSTYVDIQKSQSLYKSSLPSTDQLSAILFEYETGGKILQIDKNFNINLKDCLDRKIDHFWNLYKSFQKGDITKCVLEEFVKKNIE